MLEEVTQMLGVQVYTHRGAYLGTIDNVVMDTETFQIEELFVGETNPNIVENSVPVTIPFRWIQAIGDIIILKNFPEKVHLSEADRRRMDMQQGGGYIPMR